ncbi:CapA family protein [Salimicrobium album]|uniref:Poly-gamma-glutamate synthesis protein (Capsule biosynthesis protein) n=1 Tax=Salimicrobium album TaxID=50717 RepID=A0A1H3HFB9_9BACI|nr:CapA family protein [Salimicrobium album]SDY13925.1 poly-gamma-glutamate synthesis protein (capsule biosynthesis protein) [Salimicrobium album]
MAKLLVTLTMIMILVFGSVLFFVIYESAPEDIKAGDLEKNAADAGKDRKKNDENKTEGNSAEETKENVGRESVKDGTFNEEVDLTFTGDVLFEKSTKQTVADEGYAYPFHYVNEEFQSDDITFVNLETPITTRGVREDKIYNFRSEDKALDGLKKAGIDAVSLANNHTLDYGITGLEDTLHALEKREIPFIGAGRNKEEAYRGWKTEKEGRSIHFLAFSAVLPKVSWYAEEDRPGIASGYQVERMERIIKKAEASSDHVIVQMHWGDERQTQFQPGEQQIAHRLIDAGADVIVGHHPHVLQGFEYYKDGFIAYSLGNFLFPDYVDGETAYTGYLKVRLKEDEIHPSFIPMQIRNDRIMPAPDEKEALQRMEERSANITFEQNKIVKTSQP